MRPPAVMVPDARTFVSQFHVYWLSLASVRAQVAATILELLQVFDGVGATGGGYSSYAKW